ncbi:MAG: hypothetical protein JST54_15385 [Deltaproteobacteria bacterium]|nr:hypothetical protein [Deltaproteobacteria bacterium]
MSHKAQAAPAPEAPAVRVLTCSNCAAPLPLGTGDTVACPFCHATTPLPDDYRRLRDLHTRDAADHAQAEALFAKLDAPPWYATQVLARMFDWSLVGYLLAFMVPVLLSAMMCATLILQAAVKRFHLPPTDDNDVTEMIFTGVVMWIFVFVPRALGVYASRRTRARALLVNLFRARPPLTPGGPAMCRRCGAPLAVVEDAALARCSYCGADSAVRVRTALLQVAETDAARAHDTIERALQAYNEDHNAPKRELRRELWRYTYKLTVLFGLYALALSGATHDEFGMNDISDTTAFSAFALVIAILVFFFQWVLSQADVDEKSRVETNPVPMWVAALGPVIAWVGFFYFMRYFIGLPG